MEPAVVSRTEEESQRLIDEFKKFDPKNGNLMEFMEFIKKDKWRVQ